MTMRTDIGHAPARECRWPVTLPAVAALLAVLWTTQNVYARSSTLEEEETRTVKVETETKIYVKNARGQTIIVGRKDANAVTIRASKIVRARDAKTAAAWMKELGFTTETDGDQVSVVLHHPRRMEEEGNFWTLVRQINDRAYIDLTIEVPSGFDAKVSSTSGDVQITSIEGSVKLFGSSGDVFLKGIGGTALVELSSGDVDAGAIGKDLHIRMSSGDAVARDIGGSVSVQGTSGDAEIYDVAGDATVELSSGDLALEGCRGSVSATAYTGNIEIDEVEGAVNARTTSGDIVVTLTPVGAKEHLFESSSGDVDVSFHTPQGYGFLLEVDTGSGSIEGDLDIKLDEISRKTLKGIVGKGGGRISIETASGDIRINEIGK
jgi:hypothetical protein